MSGSNTTFDVARVRAAATQMRRDIVSMLHEAGSGHPGGSLSATDFVATLYFGGTLRHDPANPADPERDRFVLSKGHAAPALYAVLAQDGYFPREWLPTLRKLGSHLQGHPDMNKCPGVEVSTGSLGQGLSIGAGMAMGLAADAAKAGTDPRRVFVLMGDGELQEGQVWEALMSAGVFKLSNLCAIFDLNGLQATGPVAERFDSSPYREKLEAFRWHVVEINGHDFDEIRAAFKASRKETERPTAILAHTVKGKGFDFAENVVGFHNGALTQEQLDAALAVPEEE